MTEVKLKGTRLSFLGLVVTVQIDVLFPTITLTLFSLEKSVASPTFVVVNDNLNSSPSRINVGDVKNASPFTENDAPIPIETLILLLIPVIVAIPEV